MKIKSITVAMWLIAIAATQIHAQNNEQYKVQGKVSEAGTGEAMEFATVAVLELKIKKSTNARGEFELSLPAGEYTFIVTFAGKKPIQKIVTISGDATLDFSLELLRLVGSKLTIQGDRDVQKVSRYTMPKEEVKEVPGSFGDSVRAITAMAGIERKQVAGPIGDTAIRGLGPVDQRFYVDGIPVRKSMHFGGLQSIIGNEIIDEIDVYSSAFPVMYGLPLGSAIEINTIDEVKKKSVYLDIGLLSASASVLMPLGIKNSNSQTFQENNDPAHPVQENNTSSGYWLGAARYGYLTLFAPRIVKAFAGNNSNLDVAYYDYQFKGKYYLNKKHSLGVLLFGGSDSINLDINFEPKSKEKMILEGSDPFQMDVAANRKMSFHTQSLMHTFMSSDSLRNTLKFFTSLNETKISMHFKDANVAQWAKELNNYSQPDIYGIKNDFYLSFFKDLYSVKTGVEYTYYDFRAFGKSVLPVNPLAKVEPGVGPGVDISSAGMYQIIDLNFRSGQSVAGGYMENRLRYQGFELAGGFRGDYLVDHDIAVMDPRARLTYTTPTDTALSVAGGRYSSFYQTNVYYFEISPQVIKMKLQPERAIQRSIGIEQRFAEKYSAKLEAYYNDFIDIVAYTGNMSNPVANWGQKRTRGLEITLKKDKVSGKIDYYGWLNYTYGISDFKSNHPADPLGNRWISSDYDRRHSLKLISGIQFGANLLGLKFQVFSSYPETPIVGDDGGKAYVLNGQNLVRYAPAYGDKNSRYRHFQHQLDLRYSRASHFRWGQLKWYIEFLNIYNFMPDDEQKWAYNKPYGSQNPKSGSSAAFGILPNFGVEAKF